MIDWYSGKLHEVAEREGVSISTVLKRRAIQRGYKKRCYLPGERYIRFSFSLPQSQANKLIKLTEQNRTSHALQIRQIVQDYLSKQTL